MQQDLTEIAYVLDRSGSMQTLVSDAIGGFNSFLSGQQQVEGRANFTLVLFDHEYLVVHKSKDIRQVPALDANTYVPRGQTALLDAVGRTIDDLGAHLAGIPEPQRPSKVIVAIFTDGLENASRVFTTEKLAASIKHQQEKYNWEFLFLAANQDAIATAATISIPAGQAMNFAASPVGVRTAQKALDTRIAQSRQLKR
ncbi:MAG: VWA domain-containing protein [Caldilineaceae bacterium]|nr:VWA domain-containing protein [Caldilineaceae bacterium]